MAIVSRLCLLYLVLISRSSAQQQYVQRQQQQHVQRIYTNENIHEHCPTTQFHCTSHGCIWREKLCDGHADCYDKSDESFAECHSNNCTEFSFRCNYGACIDGDLICDGKYDCVDGSDENSPECFSNLSTPNTCSYPTEFTCDTAECIPSDALCDGKPDCPNGYDETHEQCQRNKCEDYLFRCNYGACIDGDSTCDGKEDCYDGSDESRQFCRHQPVNTQVVTEGCPLPRHPRHGSYRTRFGSSEVKGAVRQLVPIGTLLIYKCNEGHILRPNEPINLCSENKTWTKSNPECVVECKRISSVSQDITYSVADHEPIVPGTTAKFKCKSAYQTPNNDPNYKGITCRKDGKWSNIVYDCVAKCGKQSIDAHPLIINGLEAEPLKYPWNVGIYRTIPESHEDHIHICGGTIISETLIITAAHCLFNVSSEAPNSPTLYSVAAGKRFRKWYASAELDPYQQKRQVSQIQIQVGYKGVHSTYTYDIAILILKPENAFVFNEFVGPACVDWANNHEHEAFQSGEMGITSGWGLTSTTGAASDTLKYINLPFIPLQPDCYESVAYDFRKFLLGDKICAGYLNGSSVCEGDSGSGLLFQRQQNKLWYLRAVVSIDPAVGNGCNQYSYTAFTRVSNYITWIEDYFVKV